MISLEIVLTQQLWIIFGLSVLATFALISAQVVWFFKWEMPGIEQGNPFTKFLRYWARHPNPVIRWGTRVLYGFLFLFVMALAAGAIWLIPWHLWVECYYRPDAVSC